MGKDTNKKLRDQLAELRVRLSTLQAEVKDLNERRGHCSGCSCHDTPDPAIEGAVDVSIPSPEYEEHPSAVDKEIESLVAVATPPSVEAPEPAANKPPCSEPSDQACPRPDECPNVIQQPTQQRRVIVVGDSQARDLAKLLCSDSLLKNDDVCVFVRPGAVFEEVVAMGILAAKQNNLRTIDHVVIVAGSNDIGRGTVNTSSLAELANSVNVIIAEVPKRHDLHPSYFKDVSQLNLALEHASKEFNCLFVTVRSNRNNFTRHGLHYNYSGKAKLASCLSSSLNNFQFFLG